MERHRTDVLSLVFGLLFIAVALIGVSDLVELSATDVRWLAPGLLVLVGVLLVLPLGRARPGQATPEEPADAVDVPVDDDEVAEDAGTDDEHGTDAPGG